MKYLNASLRGKLNLQQPKYISNLLTSAATRKLDYIRAEDKLIQREREAEGDEFADKEKFVTQAYKDQMAEVRKAEEEEKKREGTSLATSALFHVHLRLPQLRKGRSEGPLACRISIESFFSNRRKSIKPPLLPPLLPKAQHCQALGP
jgi:Nuclear speckle splicing regulatory protein 1, N-terminal